MTPLRTLNLKLKFMNCFLLLMMIILDNLIVTLTLKTTILMEMDMIMICSGDIIMICMGDIWRSDNSD